MRKINITGTFLDEISHDIPHQNWGKKEWSQDFTTYETNGNPSCGVDSLWV